MKNKHEKQMGYFAKRKKKKKYKKNALYEI